jgi:hypothetical protein
MQVAEQTQAPEVVVQADNEHEKSPKESFAELRKAKEDLERQLWESRKERELFEKSLSHRQPQIQAPVEDDFDFRSLEQAEFPDGKQLAKAFNQIHKQLSDKDRKLAETQQKLLFLETTQSLKDFNEVVTAENIEKYIKSDEDNLEAVNKAENPLRKCYNLIRKDHRYLADLAKGAKVPPVSQEQQRVDKKDEMPRSGSIGVRSAAVTSAAQLSNSKMTREMKENLWKETRAAAAKR